jgi:hypothetical protein
LEEHSVFQIVAGNSTLNRGQMCPNILEVVDGSKQRQETHIIHCSLIQMNLELQFMVIYNL